VKAASSFDHAWQRGFQPLSHAEKGGRPVRAHLLCGPFGNEKNCERALWRRSGPHGRMRTIPGTVRISPRSGLHAHLAGYGRGLAVGGLLVASWPPVRGDRDLDSHESRDRALIS